MQKGVEVLMSNYVVEEAMKTRGLTVHGIVYDIASGKLNDLGIGSGAKGIPMQPGQHGADGAQDVEYELVKGNHGMLVFDGEVAEMAVR